jgi:hypothetical protein
VLIALIGMMGAWFLSRSTPRQLTRHRH